MKKQFLLLAASSIFLINPGKSQNKPVSVYHPAEAFSPVFYTHEGNEYRTADGKPGPKYWQNHADYQINAALDTAAKTLTATENLTYTNNSPNQLNELWLHLDEQTYRKDARSQFVAGNYTADQHTAGNQFKSVQVVINGKKTTGRLYHQ